MSLSDMARYWQMDSTLDTRFLWDSITPLGVPVEPEV